jgi:hypothetical protein
MMQPMNQILPLANDKLKLVVANTTVITHILFQIPIRLQKYMKQPLSQVPFPIYKLKVVAHTVIA